MISYHRYSPVAGKPKGRVGMDDGEYIAVFSCHPDREAGSEMGS